MPTKTGLPKINDIVIDQKGHEWKVVERLGNDALYSVKVRRLTPINLPKHSYNPIIISAFQRYLTKKDFKFKLK